MIEPPPIVWLMGPTSAGKTTLARTLTEHVRLNENLAVVHWDGDQVRDLLGKELSFSAESRLRVVRTLASLAGITSEAGVLTIVSALTANADARRLLSSLPRLLIVYVHCPIETCIERDPKGLYRRALAGEIDTLIGYNQEYVAPDAPDLEIDTSACDVAAGVQTLLDFLYKRGVLPGQRTDNPATGDRRGE